MIGFQEPCQKKVGMVKSYQPLSGLDYLRYKSFECWFTLKQNLEAYDGPKLVTFYAINRVQLS